MRPRITRRWIPDGLFWQPDCAGGQWPSRRPSPGRTIPAASSAEEPDPDILKAALDVSGADLDPEVTTEPERPATRSSQPLPRNVKEKTT